MSSSVTPLQADSTTANRPGERAFKIAATRRKHSASATLEPDALLPEGWLAGLRDHLAHHRSARLVTMAAAEWATRQRQQTLAADLGLPVEVLPNTQFLIEALRDVGTSPTDPAIKKALDFVSRKGLLAA